MFQGIISSARKGKAVFWGYTTHLSTAYKELKEHFKIVNLKFSWYTRMKIWCHVLSTPSPTHWELRLVEVVTLSTTHQVEGWGCIERWWYYDVWEKNVVAFACWYYQLLPWQLNRREGTISETIPTQTPKKFPEDGSTFIAIQPEGQNRNFLPGSGAWFVFFLLKWQGKSQPISQFCWVRMWHRDFGTPKPWGFAPLKLANCFRKTLTCQRNGGVFSRMTRVVDLAHVNFIT